MITGDPRLIPGKLFLCSKTGDWLMLLGVCYEISVDGTRGEMVFIRRDGSKAPIILRRSYPHFPMSWKKIIDPQTLRNIMINVTSTNAIDYGPLPGTLFYCPGGWILIVSLFRGKMTYMRGLDHSAKLFVNVFSHYPGGWDRVIYLEGEPHAC